MCLVGVYVAVQRQMSPVWDPLHIPRFVSVFVKQTSNAVSAKEVNAILFSPTTSFGRPYSFPTASLI